MRGKVRVKVERIRDVNITQNGQMLNFNLSSYDLFLTQKPTVPEIGRRYLLIPSNNPQGLILKST